MPLTTLQSISAVSNTVPSTAASVGTIGELLAHAFDRDPVTRWLVPDPGRHHRVITDLFTLAATDALTQGSIDVLTDDAGAPIAAAIWFDHTRADPPQDDLPAGLASAESSSGGWRAPFGPDVERWDVLDDLMTRHHLDGPHHYLFAIGVHPTIQGRGLGSRLLAHGYQRQGPLPAYLEATSPSSRRLYLRHGYSDLGQIHPPDGPPLWRMWRIDDPGPGDIGPGDTGLGPGPQSRNAVQAGSGGTRD